MQAKYLKINLIIQNELLNKWFIFNEKAIYVSVFLHVSVRVPLYLVPCLFVWVRKQVTRYFATEICFLKAGVDLEQPLEYLCNT